MPFIPVLLAFLRSQIGVVLIPLIITLVGLIINALTGGALSGAILSVVLAPVDSALSVVIPDFSAAEIIAAVPSEIWQFAGYYHVSTAFNFAMDTTVLLITGYITASLNMVVQSMLMKKMSKIPVVKK